MLRLTGDMTVNKKSIFFILMLIIPEEKKNVFTVKSRDSGLVRLWEGNFLYMALYECACQMALFFNAARYMISPLFSTKSIWLTQFFLIGI